MSGIGAGGFAQGFQGQQQINAQQQNANTNSQLLQLKQTEEKNREQRELYARADQDASKLWDIATKTIDAAKISGNDNQTIAKSLQPIIQSIKQLYQSSGRDPSTVDAMFAASLAKPGYDVNAIFGGTGATGKTSDAGQKYAPVIAAASDKFGIPADILYKQTAQESSFNPNEVSNKGAIGISQFMPATAKEYGVNPRDPNQALMGQAKMMADLKNQFGGNMGLALAAYNWGSGNLQKWLASGADPLKMPTETRKYVQSISGQPVEQWLGGATQQPQAQPDPQARAHKLNQLLFSDTSLTVGQREALNHEISALNKQASEQRSGHSIDSPVVRLNVQAIENGDQPPEFTRMYGLAPFVRGALEKEGVNVSKLQLQWTAAQQQVRTLNNAQMTRFRGLGVSVMNTIDEAKRLANELSNSGIPILNKAKLTALMQAEGNSPRGQLATQYVTTINTLKEEFANLAQGGYAPTESVWALANKQINENYGVLQLGSSLDEVRRLVGYRLNATFELPPTGTGGQNIYSGTGQTPGSPPPLQGGSTGVGGVKDWSTYFGGQ